MSEPLSDKWTLANQRYLVSALMLVRERLDAHATVAEGHTPVPEPLRAAQQTLAEATAALPQPAALQEIAALFGLSAFEQDLLLLCAGMELDGSFAGHCARAHGDPRRAYPTFGLAVAALPQAHWTALLPAAPLRQHRLIEVGTGESLAQSPLRIAERVLHYLTGVSSLDERLAGLVERVAALPIPSAAHAEVARRAALALHHGGAAAAPVVWLCGPDEGSRRAVAAAACAAAGLTLYAVRAAELPTTLFDRDNFLRLWEREALLGRAALLIVVDDGDSAEVGRVAAGLSQRVRGRVLVSSREPIASPASAAAALRFEVAPSTPAEQAALWRAALGPARTEQLGPERLTQLLSHFSLGAAEIDALASSLDPAPADAAGATPAAAAPGAAGDPGAADPGAALFWSLWEGCRLQARPRLSDLAQAIEPRATWDDLVLPAPQLALLREVAVHLRQQAQVYEAWGFARKSERGLGLSALFCGPSGTGKTMAAEVLARELRLDLFRIDLSQVVSKYIGETEKNLRRVFDAAEQGGAILLFDEADALFGRRSEVKDSHDRYANIEVSYLLQRMESYRGLAILTTNMKASLDVAFLRRLRFVLHFPFPGPAQRAEIWRRIFPREAPLGELDYERLSHIELAGGNIRNIALSAAFLAADVGEPVGMAHLLRAARGEYLKLEKPLTGL